MVTTRLRAALCTLALASVIVADAAYGALTVHPEANVVDESAMFEITIRDDSNGSHGNLDLSPLEADFELLGQQTESQFRSINGQVESWTDWVLTVRPRHAGKITIPSLTLGAERSAPIEIDVRPIDPSVRAKLAERVFFETDATPRRVYVGAQVVVKRRLHYAEGAQIYGELPDVPTIDGAVVQRLAEPRQYSEQRDGQSFAVVEQSFAVFPEHSGALEIPPTSINASVALPVDGLRYRRSEVKVECAPTRIDVLPVPAAYPADRPWLPATNVEVLEDWVDPDRPLSVGTPHARTVLIRATAATASMIPAVAPYYPADIRYYPEPPQLHDTVAAAGVVGLRTETANLIAANPGSLELPPIDVVWWDTVHEEVRIATLPARLVQVVGEPLARTDATPRPAEPPPTARAAPSTAQNVSVDWARHARALAYVLGAAAALVASALLGRALRARLAQPRPLFDERRAHRALRAACRADDLSAIRRALDRWLASRYGASPSLALARFRADIGNAPSRIGLDALDALDRALYGAGAPASFDRKALIAAVARARRATQSPLNVVLPPLYPG